MILVGSTYFFQNYFEDFRAKDTDYINIVDSGNGYDWVRQITLFNKCTFDIVRHTKEELINYALTNNASAMLVGQFLIPEFNNEFEITIEDIKQLKPLIENLDPLHKYEEIIYNAYIENNDFTLTDTQREEAYEVYKAARISDKEYDIDDIDDVIDSVENYEDNNNTNVIDVIDSLSEYK